MIEPTDREREIDDAALYRAAKRLARQAVTNQDPNQHPWLTLERAEEIQMTTALAVAREEGRREERERCIGVVTALWGADLVTTQAAMDLTLTLDEAVERTKDARDREAHDPSNQESDR